MAIVTVITDKDHLGTIMAGKDTRVRSVNYRGTTITTRTNITNLKGTAMIPEGMKLRITRNHGALMAEMSPSEHKGMEVQGVDAGPTIH
jgi:hypothetical protein